MKILILTLLLCAQAQDGEVERLVRSGDYPSALLAAQEADGADRFFLVTWTRHHAGDLRGALAEAESGLSVHPDDLRLLEQAAWLSASLHRGEASLSYAKRLEQLGYSPAEAYIKDAEALILVTDEVSSSRRRALILLSAFALVSVLASGWGLLRT